MTKEENTDMEQTKVFNDCIHGHIELPPLCVKIVDTPEFQRLRFIKQLSACYFVYPGASHNRFEHSLGVCYLAGELVKAIQRRQEDLHIDDKDVLCVQIAGLCHDIGHGPFSHIFDGVFMLKINPNKRWKHEEISVKLFDYLVEENDLMADFIKSNLQEQDIVFIKEQINGFPLNGNEFMGRGEEKWFLYEIVANHRNGIDVDKWDYLARDCCMLGIPNSFDYKRFMQYARVIDKQICTRDKQIIDIYEMLQIRKKLHEQAYQHRVSNLIGLMIAEALYKANDFLEFKGTDGKNYRLSDAHEDMGAYVQLTDDVVFSTILHSRDDNLSESREIITNILHRKLYPLVSEAISEKGQAISSDKRSEKIKEILNACCCNKCEKVKETDVELDLMNTDYGMKQKDPVENCRFYRKDEPDKCIGIKKIEVSQTLPAKFDDQRIRLYCKTYDEDKENLLRHLFQTWCKKNKFALHSGSHGDDHGS